MTKAVGGLMAVMAIDRGLVTLDTPVGDILPAFDELQVLEAVTAEGPQFRRPKTRASLRHLLTHTSGVGHQGFYPLMAEYAQITGASLDVTGTLASLNYPLLFDPGTGFAYGISTDWVGALVAELEGRPVEQFVREDILEPLGMKSTYFEREHAGDRLADQGIKPKDGSFEPIEFYPAANPELYHMGHALYSSASDYLTFLRFILNRGKLNGQRIVGSAAMALMFDDQLRGSVLPTPVLKSYDLSRSYDVDPFPGVRTTHTAGFLRNEEAIPGRRDAGSLSWTGLLNTHYWIDPTRKIAAVFMTQMLPFWDPDVMSSLEEFEHAVYEKLGQ
jgi:CubicO group peptidase (beta-lactamase class C family)